MEHELLTVQNVKDLQDGGKRWLENVLGQHLRENQQVFIMVFTPGVEPNEAVRRGALASVQRTMTHVEKNLAAQGVTDEAFDAAVDEAMEDVRRREP
jgi:L-fucose isomerase-like protein